MLATNEFIAISLMKFPMYEFSPQLAKLVSLPGHFPQSRGIAVGSSLKYSNPVSLEDICAAGHDYCYDSNIDDYTCIAAGSTCCGNGNSCPSGYDCIGSDTEIWSCVMEADSQGTCNSTAVPSSLSNSIAMEECYVYTSTNQFINSRTATCMPSGAVCCGNGYFCPKGSSCGGDYYCFDVGSTYCPDYSHDSEVGAMPTGSTCCYNGFYCTTGYVCQGDGTCCLGDGSKCANVTAVGIILPAAGATELTLAPLQEVTPPPRTHVPSLVASLPPVPRLDSQSPNLNPPLPTAPTFSATLKPVTSTLLPTTQLSVSPLAPPHNSFAPATSSHPATLSASPTELPSSVPTATKSPVDSSGSRGESTNMSTMTKLGIGFGVLIVVCCSISAFYYIYLRTRREQSEMNKWILDDSDNGELPRITKQKSRNIKADYNPPIPVTHEKQNVAIYVNSDKEDL